MDPPKNILNVETCSDTDFCELYHQGKKVVWLMKIEYVTVDSGSDTDTDTAAIDELYLNGFALDKEYIITTHHDLPLKDVILNAQARPLTEDNFKYEVEVVLEKPLWDIAWFKIKEADGCSSGVLPSDCSLSVGQELVHIDGSNCLNSNAFAGLFSVGRVAFKCVDKVDLPKNDDVRFCKDYIFNYLSCVPEYRIMGHVCNSFTTSETSEHEILGTSIAKYVHPQVPLIQISGLCFRGISGSPLFNDKGEIVGMMVFDGTDGFSFAIHASMLKEALKELDIHKTNKDQIS